MSLTYWLFVRRRIMRQQRRRILVIKRHLRDTQNPFENSTERQFLDLYRFPKHLCLDFLEEIKPRFFLNERKSAIPVHLRFLCALRFFAAGNFQRTIGQDFLACMSQTSVQRCIHKVADILNEIGDRYIYLPNEQEEINIKTAFHRISSFPGIIGLIDGTHIKIIAPSADIEHAYYCRKGGHSINVLIVCDSNYIIRYCNAKFPGTLHDAYIFRRSALQEHMKNMYEQGKINFWLLGDSGFPLQPWLMTPYNAITSEAEEKYNIARKITRCVVERCMGILKSRFRCLSIGNVLNYDPTKAGRIINACILLHNVIHNSNVYNESEGVIENDNNGNDENTQSSINTDNGNRVWLEGQRIRQKIAE